MNLFCRLTVMLEDDTRCFYVDADDDGTTVVTDADDKEREVTPDELRAIAGSLLWRWRDLREAVRQALNGELREGEADSWQGVVTVPVATLLRLIE